MQYTKGNDIHGEMERMLVEDVRTAVRDMVELIKTYRSKKRLSQVIISTMFRRRMAETDAVIDRAIADLKVSAFARFFELPHELLLLNVLFSTTVGLQFSCGLIGYGRNCGSESESSRAL